MSKHNWQLSTVEEIAVYIPTTKANILNQQVFYYKKTCNTEMLERITKAKRIVLLGKLEQEIRDLKIQIEKDKLNA